MCLSPRIDFGVRSGRDIGISLAPGCLTARRLSSRTSAACGHTARWPSLPNRRLVQGVVVRISGEYRTQEASSRSSWLLAISDRQLEVETFAVDVPYSNRDRRRVGPAFPPSPALAPAFELERPDHDGISNSIDDLKG